MKTRVVRRLAVVATATAGLASCRSGSPASAPAPATGAPPSAAPVSRTTHLTKAGDAAADSARRAAAGYTIADVRFMQGMIAHHAQAIAMAGLLRTRTTRPDMQLLGERITVSQRDEIRMMQHWLSTRREMVPSPDTVYVDGAGRDTHGMHDMPGMAIHDAMGPMPGMLSPAEMTSLAAASGTAFDRLFLRFMIRHHEGALSMVATLLGSPGAGQEVETFRFASDVDADQRAEIARMRALLATPSTP